MQISSLVCVFAGHTDDFLDFDVPDSYKWAAAWQNEQNDLSVWKKTAQSH